MQVMQFIYTGTERDLLLVAKAYKWSETIGGVWCHKKYDTQILRKGNSLFVYGQKGREFDYIAYNLPKALNGKVSALEPSAAMEYPYDIGFVWKFYSLRGRDTDQIIAQLCQRTDITSVQARTIFDSDYPASDWDTLGSHMAKFPIRRVFFYLTDSRIAIVDRAAKLVACVSIDEEGCNKLYTGLF